MKTTKHKGIYRFMKLRSFLQSFGASLILLFNLTGCQNERVEQHHLQTIQERGSLRIGTLLSPVHYYLGRDQTGTGFEYDLLSAFAESLGVTLQLDIRHDMDDLWQLIDQGTVDFLAAGLAMTDERHRIVRFTPPYHQVAQVLVYRQDAFERPQTWSQVSGQVKVVGGSSHESMLRSLAIDYPDLTWSSTRMHDADELLEQVMQGRLDFTMTYSHHFHMKQRTHPELSAAFTVQDHLGLAWAFAHGVDDSLYAAAIEFVGKAHESNLLSRLADRYFGPRSQFHGADTRSFIAAVHSTLPHYRALFQEYAGEFDWRLLAALAYQESNWQPLAQSRQGAEGIMMLTLATAEQLAVLNRLEPEQSIRGGALYLQQLHRRLPDRILAPDRLWMALAAYHIGIGHLEDARLITQRQGGNPDYWIDVRERLPLLRQRQYYRNTRFGFARGDEAVRYVENIRRYYDTLIWLEDQGNQPSLSQGGPSAARESSMVDREHSTN